MDITEEMVKGWIKEAVTGVVSTLPEVIKTTVTPMLKEAPPATKPTPEAPPATKPTPEATPTIPPDINAKMQEQARQINDMTNVLKTMKEEKIAADAKAEKAEREGAIRDALSGYSFVNEEARQAAFRLISSDVKRNENGVLIGGDNLPVADFVKDQLTTKHDYFLAPEPVSGAGASSKVTRSQSTIGVEAIKKDMSATERTAVAQEIGRTLAGMKADSAMSL